MKDLDKAYHTVFRDIMLNGPDMFRGIYDAKNGNKAFMYGIQTVMEYIAIHDSEEHYEEFSDMFTKNIVKSIDKISTTDNKEDTCYV